ncbi:MAG: UDP-2,3-diacylglucosamine diphosphatase [Betaproteobacteria bacterium]|nr:MAG: UDP-2,3-diacylglucosamine diphosphatase [Betaproteobacteria bacterium]
MRALFISDLHLHERDVATHARFIAFMHGPARQASHLYVIGDLFHVWLGDRMLPSDDYALSVAAEFRAVNEAGVAIFIARGNRDFMLGQAFARACGATLLAEQTHVDLGSKRALLLHGDELCTDDVRYQRVRRVLRTTLFRVIGDALPVAWRYAIARKLRRESDAHKAVTAMRIMDANHAAIERTFERQGVTLMIHGHTHRPADHLSADGKRRIVLSDWQQAFGFLEWRDGDFHVNAWPTTQLGSASN